MYSSLNVEDPIPARGTLLLKDLILITCFLKSYRWNGMVHYILHSSLLLGKRNQESLDSEKESKPRVKNYNFQCLKF